VTATDDQRAWRYRLRHRLLRLLGPFCSFCGTLGTQANRLEFAHKVPLLRRTRNGLAKRRSMDELLRAVREAPHLFVVACQKHHRRLDAPIRREQHRPKARRAAAAKETPRRSRSRRPALAEPPFGYGERAVCLEGHTHLSAAARALK
jgi:hypothetical protein